MSLVSDIKTKQKKNREKKIIRKTDLRFTISLASVQFVLSQVVRFCYFNTHTHTQNTTKQRTIMNVMHVEWKDKGTHSRKKATKQWNEEFFFALMFLWIVRHKICANPIYV